jgi:AmmeMemoRadiSam system protein A
MAAGEDAPALVEPDRHALLSLARQALRSHLERRAPPDAPASPALRRPHGAFVSLHRRSDGALRGCVGSLDADEPLWDVVARMAVAAASRDARFEPVRLEELPDVIIEVSVLGPLLPLRPEQIQVGRHGVLISAGGLRGVLLPQVPVEHGWDREALLDRTCRKAGLPAETWRRGEAQIFGFTATVFGEA